MSLGEEVARLSDTFEVRVFDRRRLLEEITLSNRALVRASDKEGAATRALREHISTLNRDLQSLHEDVKGGVSQLIASNERREEALQEIANGVWELSAGMQALGASFRWGIAEVVHQFELQHAFLRRIIEVLEAPLETQAKELRKRAEDAYRNGWVEEALTDFQEAEKKNYADFTIHQSIGNLYFFEKNELHKGLEYYNKAVRYARPRSAFHTSYALLHVALTRYLGDLEGGLEGAYQATLEAIDLTPDFLQARYEHARYCALLEKQEESIAQLARAMEGDRNYGWKLLADPAFMVLNNAVKEFLQRLSNEAKGRVEELASLARNILAEIPLSDVQQYHLDQLQKIEGTLEKINLSQVLGFLDYLSIEEKLERLMIDIFTMSSESLSSRKRDRTDKKLSETHEKINSTQKRHDQQAGQLKSLDSNLADNWGGIAIGAGIAVFVLLIFLGAISSFTSFLVVAAISFFSGICTPFVIYALKKQQYDAVMNEIKSELNELKEISIRAEKRSQGLEHLYQAWLGWRQTLEAIAREISNVVSVQSKARERFVHRTKECLEAIRALMQRQYTPGYVCPHCGGEIDRTAPFCDYCGCAVGGHRVQEDSQQHPPGLARRPGGPV